MSFLSTTSTDTETAIEVKGVSKAYRIWKNPAARLKHPIFQALGSVIPRALQPKSLRRRIGETEKTPYYTDFYALKDINLTVKRGEAVGIIGRNGSGKSTLLQIIAGTLTPTTGTIKINGRVAALLELGSGFNPEFTGRENVYLNASILGLTQKEITDRYQSIADFADIGDFIDQPVKTYSSGMMMRLAFAVIAHVDANILIVDESLSVGDVFFVQKCMRFIHEFRKRGTLLLVTHDTAAVTALCERALWLHKGEVQGIDSAKEIAERYLEATYAEKQGVVLFDPGKGKKNRQTQSTSAPVQHLVDQRSQFINGSNMRNDIEIFRFDPESAAFGAGGAVIKTVRLLDAESRQPLAYVVGGEVVILEIAALARTDLDRPILGFQLKNRHGQTLFVDNTYMSYRDNPCMVRSGETITATFQFQMPVLPVGDYVFNAACANGTQFEHMQHHWLHEALAFRSQSSYILDGMIGLPMLEITLCKT